MLRKLNYDKGVSRAAPGFAKNSVLPMKSKKDRKYLQKNADGKIP